MSIPKILHYCWFGGGPKPPLAEKCLKSWKKYCPDYQILEWNEETFDLSDVPLYVRQALEERRWAFVTDYVRLRVLTERGGVYLDTDVELVKPLDRFLKHRAFAGLERVDAVQTGLLACEPGFGLFLDFLKHYDTALFRRDDGTVDTTTNVEVLTALCRDRGLVFEDRYQEVDGLAVYPRAVFCPVDFHTQHLRRTRQTVAIHWFASSWKTEQERRQEEAERARLRYEKVSAVRHAVFTKLLGENMYQRLKALLPRR